MIKLFKLHTGEVCCVVNGHIIMAADPDFDEPSKVEEAAKKLAMALNLPLTVVHAEREHDAQGIDWPALIKKVP